jgi:hypothetical protein
MRTHGCALRIVFIALGVATTAAAAHAQTIGTFRWQLAPYCNVVTLTVTQNGGSFTLDGFDDQCGAAQRAAVAGTAFPNPDGSIGIGLAIVTAPGGTPLSVSATIAMSTISGAWRDSAGGSGTFVFSPSTASGTPRPVPVTAFPAGLSATGHTIVQVADPVGPSDAATKQYVDTAIPPPSRFKFQADGGFVAGGEVFVGTIPADGGGTRMMWHPNKAAFRAGTVQSDRWDNHLVGQYSAALGFDAMAGGMGSMAFGDQVLATNTAAIALGSGTEARGQASLAAGAATGACGVASIALGWLASTSTDPTTQFKCAGVSHQGAFIFSSSGPLSFFTTVADREFAARATGGFRFRTNAAATTGCNLPAGSGAFACSSDANLKRDFQPLEADEVLAKLARLDVSTWTFVDEPAVRHVGPTAQAFHAAFGLGADDTSISYTDINGINMRAIQALEERTRNLITEIAALRAELAALKERR